MQGIVAERMKRKAARAAAIHHEVFSGIAKQYGVTVVAGSIPLPGPQIIDGHLTVDRQAHPFRGVGFALIDAGRPITGYRATVPIWSLWVDDETEKPMCWVYDKERETAAVRSLLQR